MVSFSFRPAAQTANVVPENRRARGQGAGSFPEPGRAAADERAARARPTTAAPAATLSSRKRSAEGPPLQAPCRAHGAAVRAVRGMDLGAHVWEARSPRERTPGAGSGAVRVLGPEKAARAPLGARVRPRTAPPNGRFLTHPGDGGADFQRIDFGFVCHSPITAPVGSERIESQPMSATGVTSLMIFAPSDCAFFVAAWMSSTST